jgi:hypothetical protein
MTIFESGDRATFFNRLLPLSFVWTQVDLSLPLIAP